MANASVNASRAREKEGGRRGGTYGEELFEMIRRVGYRKRVLE